MSLSKRSGSSRTLAHRLTLWFSLLVLIPMLLSTFIIDRISSNSLREKALMQLAVTAKSKASALERYAFERARAAGVLGRIKRLAEGAVVLQTADTGSAAYLEARTKVDAIANYFAPNLGFSDVILVSPRGNVLFQTQKNLDLGSNIMTGPQRSSPLAALVRRTQTLLEPDISDFAVYPGTETPLAFVAAPIILDNGRTAGFVVMQINSSEIYDIITD
jgi:hypothetical protein